MQCMMEPARKEKAPADPGKQNNSLSSKVETTPESKCLGLFVPSRPPLRVHCVPDQGQPERGSKTKKKKKPNDVDNLVRIKRHDAPSRHTTKGNGYQGRSSGSYQGSNSSFNDLLDGSAMSSSP